MFWQFAVGPGIRINLHAGHAPQLLAKLKRQRFVGRLKIFESGIHGIRHRTEIPAQCLGQRFHQGNALFSQQSRHQPFQATGRYLLERHQGHLKRNAVLFTGGFELIAQRVTNTLPLQIVRVQVSGLGINRSLKNVCFGELQFFQLFRR